ncbi:hypothetical protein MMC18_008365 [Xylographa bjoerkii]|nr:hypothetical protein [Xylographa bjoerkii]
MAFKQEASSDPLDIDRYLNYDQSVYPSPSISPSSSARGKTIATAEFSVEAPVNPFIPAHSSSQPLFPPPSHQYESYKQSTGLPVGALAHTLAVNQPNTFGYGAYQQSYNIPPSDGYFGMNTGMTVADDIFDFNSVPVHNPSFSSSTDMDVDFDSPLSDLFIPQASKSDYVNPSAIGGQEDISPSNTPVQSQVGRLWPGMHQQQAALAKAQAQQRQQKARPAPPQIVVPQHQQAARAPAQSSRPAADPIVEERISRLLNQMRQSSVSSSHDDDSSTPTANQHHIGRQRKDEEDMDEDERLLASEEGKKLSSKERRQLRNKVSARAFRSRRKEYIGQLEGELAVKGKEADDLRSENDALKAENTRLTDLTRMLLSSSAFSSFLNDLSNNGLPAAPVHTPSSATSSASSHQQVQPVRKDANPNQRQFQNQIQGGAQIGMALVPDTNMDFSVFGTTPNAWAANLDMPFNTQVFSVTELPQGPAVDSIDIGLLSGKSCSNVESFSSDETKEEIVAFERMPVTSEKQQLAEKPEATFTEVELDASNPAFALFVDYPVTATSTVAKPKSLESEYQVFGGIELEKAFARLDLVIEDDSHEEDGEVSSAVMSRLSEPPISLTYSIDMDYTRSSTIRSLKALKAASKKAGHNHGPLHPSVSGPHRRGIAIATAAVEAAPIESFPLHEPLHQHNLVSSSRRKRLQNAKPFSAFLTDAFSREHDYLRISITERCNLRCVYCMPEEGVPLSPPSHLLTTPEIVYLSSLFVRQGVTKIRLTGGEPTIRRDILPLMHSIGDLRRNGLKELCLTTNGITLFRKLDSMVEAGLTGVNLSLDTLDPFQFQIMTRRKGFEAVMKSIDRILEMNQLGAGIKLKVNCVVMRGLNEREILPFVEMGREKDVEVRFIEYMPFDGNKWSKGKMLGYQEMLGIIREKYPGLRKVQDGKNETSKTFEVPGFVGRIGFITSMTENFCGSCNRLRITSDGNLKVCLFGNAEVSLRDLLRKANGGAPIDDEAWEAMKRVEMDRRQAMPGSAAELGYSERERELLDVIGMAVKRKKEKHAGMGELENMKNRPMILIDDPPPHPPRPSTPQLPSTAPSAFSTATRNPSSNILIPYPLLSPPHPSPFATRAFSTAPPTQPPPPSSPSHLPSPPTLPHLTPTSTIHIVSISSKPATHRRATAAGHVRFSTPAPLPLIRHHQLRKGDVLAVARVAGVLAAKRAADLVPLAHGGLALEGVRVGVWVVGPEEGIGAVGKDRELGAGEDRELARLGGGGTGERDEGGTGQLGVHEEGMGKEGTRGVGAFGGVRIAVVVECTGKTGVEMEALAGVVGAALTVVDMCKGVDRGVRIEGVRCVRKEGGRSGVWREEGWEA